MKTEIIFHGELKVSTGSNYLTGFPEFIQGLYHRGDCENIIERILEDIEPQKLKISIKIESDGIDK